MENWLNRTEMLIGKENVTKLKNSHIVVFGIGGVGSYVVEGLVRSGIGRISIVDKDVVDVTNINRQIIADTETIGMSKVDAEENRIQKINPHAQICKVHDFVAQQNIDNIMERILTQNGSINYVVDAIDTVSSKIEIIKYCNKNNIKIISCMGTGNKLDASKFEITNISKTSVCPLAKVMRKELKKLGIDIKVLYSKEEPIKPVQFDNGSVDYEENNIDKEVSICSSNMPPASISFVPSVAGLLIAGEVVKDLIK